MYIFEFKSLHVLTGDMDNKTAVIIGAGIGGIATSVFLARNGYQGEGL